MKKLYDQIQLDLKIHMKLATKEKGFTKDVTLYIDAYFSTTVISFTGKLWHLNLCTACVMSSLSSNVFVLLKNFDLLGQS